MPLRDEAEEKLTMQGTPMHAESMLRELEAQRARIDDAIRKLKTQMGGPRSTEREGRVLSAITKQRISETMKRQWAERKKRKKARAYRAAISPMEREIQRPIL
jgi:hypothetical protein